MPVVRLGNCEAIIGRDNEGRAITQRGDFISEITVHDHDPHADQFRNITHADGLWPRFSTQPATWVSCAELPRLERALSAHFDCDVLPHGETMLRVHAAMGLTPEGINVHSPEEVPDHVREATEAEADRNAELFRLDPEENRP